MKSITLSKGEAIDLSFCLGATAPKSVPTLKELFEQDKIRSKFEEPIIQLKDEMAELQRKGDKAQQELSDTPKEHREAKVKEINERMKVSTDLVNVLREEEVTFELSDEQVDYLKKNYIERVACSLTRLDYAAKIATKLGLE